MSDHELVREQMETKKAELTARLERITANLRRGYDADSLHGDMSQSQREKILNKFKKKLLNILVATDVAARGIDVQDLTHVINYSLPQDPESYVHRIGRTGRAGKEGIAVKIKDAAVKEGMLLHLQFLMDAKIIDVTSKVVHIEEQDDGYLVGVRSLSARDDIISQLLQ